MRDQTAIKSFCRYPQGGDVVAYFFGKTTIVAEEWENASGHINIRPVRGDQVAFGEWYDLDEADVAAYCELLEDEINGRESA